MFCWYWSGDHPDLHVLTPCYPTLRSSDLQSVSVLAELIFVHIFFERRAKDTASLAECPAMIGTFEALRAPLFLPAQRHAAMGAGVEQYRDPAVIAPRDPTGILHCIATDKLARHGKLGFVIDRLPGTGAH